MEFMTTKRVANMADLTPDAIRYHARKGHLLTIKVERAPGEFQRLFVKEDVERFLQQRATQREMAAAAKEHPDEP